MRGMQSRAGEAAIVGASSDADVQSAPRGETVPAQPLFCSGYGLPSKLVQVVAQDLGAGRVAQLAIIVLDSIWRIRSRVTP